MNKAFSAWPWTHGHIADLDPRFPSYLSAWNRSELPLAAGDTHFGYIEDGFATLAMGGFLYRLPPAHVFCAPGPATILAGGGRGMVVSRRGWKGLPMVAGPIEQMGRLRYIDGCTDSLLIPPVKMGDPCLNLLYFPPGIDQTAHTHPSDRIGIILSGHGLCHAWDDGSPTELIDLKAGMLFTIHTDGKHKFSTPFGEEMRVLAYHPDSDFGPRDDDHPMINRTIVEGVSAKHIASIQTQ